MMKLNIAVLAVASVAAIPVQASPILFSASGSIQATVDAFRAGLGANNGVGGSFSSGRREINWDGVPDSFSAPNNLPANFFNVNSPRGAVFSGASGFQVSGSGANPVRFDNLNPTYSTTFAQTFSSPRLFTSLGSNIYDVNFFVPGTTTAATVNGFGAVFADVDAANTTAIEYFNGAISLGKFYAPSSNFHLSFLGVIFNAGERVSSVRVTNGSVAVGALDAFHDVVVNDDFIYGEPTAVPEPSAALLAGFGLACLGIVKKLRG